MLQKNVVPVVLGGADYDLVAPPSSYINVNDFRSPKDLAVYLKHLMANPHEYLQYFWWKEHYRVNKFVELKASVLMVEVVMGGDW